MGARNDILIRGGLLFDGTGAAGKPGDIAVRDGRIAAVGARIDDTAAKVIDAHGLAVAPGFIDIKTHSDFTLPINPKAESKVRQGVTTEIVGHCGFSVAPALPGKVELLRDYLSASAPASSASSSKAIMASSSADVGGRFSMPMTMSRSVLWPTSMPAFTAVAGKLAR